MNSSVNMSGMGIDLSTYRRESLENWGRVAPGWEDRREWMVDNTARVNAWLVETVDPQPGQTILEIGAGPGELGLQVAERLEGGRLISTDFAPEMVEVARRQSEARGLTNVEHRVLDAEAMDLADDSVDGVVCRWAYMLMADPAAALAETRRVLRRGGPLAFAVWGTAERNPWQAVPAMTIVQRGHRPPPEPGAPGIFAMGDPARIRELVTGAGFDEPELEEIAFEYHYVDFDDLWGALVGLSAFGSTFDALPDEEREATRTAVRESMAPYRDEDGSYTAPAATWVVLAR
jgi:ubiquinone/menaquinone biosynthesis C-methylase UbiE